MYRVISQQAHMEAKGRVAPSGKGWHRGYKLANWLQRMCSAIVDYGPPAAACFYLGWYGFVLGVVFIFWSCVWMQSATGQSLGKCLLGLTLVVPILEGKHARPLLVKASKARLLFRTVCHLGDAFLLLGVLRIANTDNRTSLADDLAMTLVVSSSSVPFVRAQGAPDPG